MNASTWLLTLCLLWTTAAGQQPMEIVGLPANAPLTLSASASNDELTLDVKMKPGWHLYAKDVGGGEPVSVTIEEGAAFTARKPLVVPKGTAGKLTGAFRLVLPLKRSGPRDALKARFAFMACDPIECLPPMSVTLTGSIPQAHEQGVEERLKVLLVVDVADSRSQRISDFFGKHGLATTVATYWEVTKSACDASDVVLADSKLFRKSVKGSRARVLAFPKTSSPIVAVGFLGTELIEAHGIAMTSGYI